MFRGSSSQDAGTAPLLRIRGSRAHRRYLDGTHISSMSASGDSSPDAGEISLLYAFGIDKSTSTISIVLTWFQY